MSVSGNLARLKKALPPGITLVAVTKTHGTDKIMEAYEAGQRDFGENRVQELLPKAQALPKDIRWHLIGHLQSNKVKYIAPFIHMIHSVDSSGLLSEISRQAIKCERTIPFLIQVRIAKEESKYGASLKEVQHLTEQWKNGQFPGTLLSGCMGMASLTDNEMEIRKEFTGLKEVFTQLNASAPDMKILSMGMSSDWPLAVECGSNMIRVGSSIFGQR
ncbi:MAG: YggS family pyridoxal phosphate-dependent enzyme [Bacteroidia bacterium]|nr:YggS family pyridoxal phosphate-dependent enzyme [Bacteroidia bacterium]